jgi:hypothetical protein
LLTLRAFFDDSNINQGPVYVLAGWVGPAEKWAPFSDEWQAILDMNPRVGPFKYSEPSEAVNGSGGWDISEPARNQSGNFRRTISSADMGHRKHVRRARLPANFHLSSDDPVFLSRLLARFRRRFGPLIDRATNLKAAAREI